MFEKITKIFTDKEFLDSFIEQNILQKVAPSLTLKRDLKSGRYKINKHIKPIYLQILENYISVTETIVMFLYSLHLKSLGPQKSLIEYYIEIYIKEGNKSGNGFSTYNILDEIEILNQDEIIQYFNFKNFDTNIYKQTKDWQNQQEDYSNMGRSELNLMFSNLLAAISNRIKNPQGLGSPLIKILNKLKHGSQFISDPSSEYIYIISKVDHLTMDSVRSEVYAVKCNVEDACLLADQSKLMAESLENFIRVYMFCNYD
ncbi:MAG: hypothetical protein P4L45_09750 [Ignavibacteriaceae bacterium]|nr:hypothetical protein [Ignavibacteriaceae bacterium]